MQDSKVIGGKEVKVDKKKLVNFIARHNVCGDITQNLSSLKKEVSEKMDLFNFWSSVNHLAIVVSDVGRSLSFYTNVIGMKQVMRPDFDRHGAWLSMGNLALHLIKGRPSVHPDDDLIVGHIAIDVSDVDEIRNRLKALNIASRTNVSVPNPADNDTGIVNQVIKC